MKVEMVEVSKLCDQIGDMEDIELGMLHERMLTGRIFSGCEFINK